MPAFTSQALRHASKGFKLATSQVCGLHPTLFASASDLALTALCWLLHHCEIHCVFPAVESEVLVSLLAKPDGGFRPIVFFRGVAPAVR